MTGVVLLPAFVIPDLTRDPLMRASGLTAAG